MMARSLRSMISDERLVDDGSASIGIRALRAPVAAQEPKRSSFVVEALLLLICLMIVITVSISIFAFAAAKGAGSAREENAIIMATNIAEQFAADPNSLQERYVDGDYVATCALSISMDAAGSLYDTTIDIDWKGDRIYSLSTSKYVSRSNIVLYDEDAFGLSEDGYDADRAFDLEGDEEASGIFDDDEGWAD